MKTCYKSNNRMAVSRCPESFSMRAARSYAKIVRNKFHINESNVFRIERSSPFELAHFTTLD